jgi:peptidylprolyl isomerase
MNSRTVLLVALVLALGLAGAPTSATSKPEPAASPPQATAPAEADMRTPDPRDLLVIETTKGRILVELNDVAAPETADRIRTLARQGFFNGRAFFRVIDNFMDQTGDPLDTGMGASSLPNLQPEFTFKRDASTEFARIDQPNGQEEGFVGSLPVISQPMDLGLLTLDHKVDAWGAYCPGVLGLARSDDPASGNSQFFLMRTNANSADHGNHALDRQYTAFGRVIAGQDVVDAIKTGEPVTAPQDKIVSVQVVADMPAASRPGVGIVDAASQWARAEAARLKTELGPDFTVCAVKLPVEAK